LRGRPRNIEGAFPLLLIGSVLLVYCAVLRNEALASSGAHFPLWGVVGGVGAVIAGAGVYSVFLDPSAPPEPAPEGFVMVPKAEWEAALSARRASTRSTSPTNVPPWWEGPEIDAETPQVRPNRPAASRQVSMPSSVAPARASSSPRLAGPPSQRLTGGASSALPPPPVPSRLATPSGPTPSSPRKTPLSELEAAISELEAMADDDFKPAPRRTGKAGPEESQSCADCGRGMASDRDPSHCTGCARKLCVDCALASQFEDADLRCIECRARGSRPGHGAKTVARRR
jgi:hypothetical protein